MTPPSHSDNQPVHPDAGTCPRCGHKLLADTPEGLCTRCLILRANFALQLAEAPPEPEPPSQSRLGDFTLVEEIARGGMGVVWKAQQSGLNRTVALKLLLAGEWASPEYVARFRTEALAAAGLDHPHIVPVYGHGQQDGNWYIAMKYVEGRSLAAMLASQGPMDPRAAAVLVRKLALALDYAHQRGVLHRDLKPANVLLDRDGEPNLTDFGLARIERDGESALTQTHAVMGTPCYLAPEVAVGGTRSATTAVDVYGLGTILYECLVGKPPFRGSSAVDTVRQVISAATIAPSALNARVDRDLSTICLKCLEKEPARRYGSAAALAGDIARFLNGEPLLARPAGPVERLVKWSRRRPWPAALAAVLLLSTATVVVLSVVYYRHILEANARITRQNEERRTSLRRLHLESGARLAEERDYPSALTEFAEAAALDEGDEARQFVHRLRFSRTLQHCALPLQTWKHEGGVRMAVFDGEEKRVVTGGMDGFARVWDAEGGALLGQTETHAAPVYAVSVSPDGAFFSTRTKDGQVRLWRMADATPATEPVKGVAPVEMRFGRPEPVSFSADGRYFATLEKQLVVLRGADGAAAGSTRHNGMVHSAVFAPSGDRLLTCDAEGGLRILAVPSLQVLAQRQTQARTRHAMWSADGTRVAAVGVTAGAAIFNAADLEPLRTLGTNDSAYGAPTTRDGRALVFGFHTEARVARPDGEWLSPPLRHGGPVFDAVWSPDSARVLTACADGLVRLWDPPAGRLLLVVARHPGGMRRAVFDRSGERVLTCGDDGTARLWRMPRADGALSRRRQGPGGAGIVSPDNRRHTTHGDGPARVWAVDDPRAGPLTLADGAKLAATGWSPDETRILGITEGAPPRVKTWDAASGELLATVPLTDAPRDPRHPVFTPDGTGVFLAAAGENVRLHDVATGGVVWRNPDLADQVTAWFTADGTRLLTSRRGTLHALDARTGATARRLPLPGEAAFTLQGVTDDLTRMAWSDRDFGVWTNDSAGGAPARVGRHFSLVHETRPLHGGRIIASSSWDGTVRLWDAATGEPAAPALPHDGYCYRLFPSRDHTRLLTTSQDGLVRVWDTAPGDWTPARMRAEAARVNGLD